MSAPRITSSMIHRGVLADLNSVASKLADTQRKMATGKELTRPSDDPYAVGHALGLRTELDGLTQFRRNAAEAESWTAASDSALGRLTDIVHRSHELLLSGATGTASASDRKTMAAEVDALIDAAKQEANTDVGGRSIFSGTATNVKPYNLATDAYNGDSGDIVRTIGPGVSVAINVRASDILGDGTDGKMINTLRNIAAHLRGGTAADQTALGTDITAIDRSLDVVLNARAQIGGVANRLSAADDRLYQLEESTRNLLSTTEDADMAATLIDYSMQQSVYQSALRAGAGIVQASLMDFLH